LFSQSVAEFSNVIATDNPDLSAFKKDGGKIIIWHGLADQLIFPQGTVNYYPCARPARHGRPQGNRLLRPAVPRIRCPALRECCRPGASRASAAAGFPGQLGRAGQAPTSILGATTDPATGVVTDSRPLCRYPRFARYTGHGSTTQASSFVCAS